MTEARQHIVAVGVAWLVWCAYVAVLAAANRQDGSFIAGWVVFGLMWSAVIAALGAFTSTGRSFLPDQIATVAAAALVGRAVLGGDTIVLAPLGVVLFLISLGTASEAAAGRR